ncbi:MULTISPECIES: HAMP domain-containing histidine kinase [Allobacillus]|nr:HAMP domain-containing histidine kinase [Allobacillus salarius]
MNLKNRIFLYTAVVFVVITILLSITIYFTFSHITYDREIDQMEDEVTNILTGIAQADESFPVNDLLGVYVPSNGMLRILDEQGNQLSEITSGDYLSLRKVTIPFNSVRMSGRTEDSNTVIGYVQVPTIWQNGEVVYVQLFENLSAVQDNLRTLRFVLVLVVLVAIIPVMVSGRVLADFISRPIQSLIRTMQDIQTSSSFKHIEYQQKPGDELYTMTRTFNEMIDLLKDNYEKQEAFVSNASHELRTPITVIESYANLVKRRGLEKPELVMESIEAIHSEAVRMRDLTEQLLMLARRQKDWQLHVESFSLSETVKRASQNIEYSYGRTVKLTIDEDIPPIRSDQQKIKQLLYIFIDNARKYSEESIEIDIKMRATNYVINIKDYGIGIPEESIGKIFDRFYRVDEARSRDEGGSGLGLALASDLAEALDIKIDVQSQVGEGTTVTLTIPSSVSH